MKNESFQLARFLKLQKRDKNGIYLLSVRQRGKEMGGMFEELYLKVRAEEGRLLDDEIVLNLPNVPKSMPYRQEWGTRGIALAKIKNIIIKASKQSPIRDIIDVGCGNGWTCSNLAQVLPETYIYGIDINYEELKQANKLFSRPTRSQRSITFLYGDMNTCELPESCVDVILLGASIQYFQNLSLLIPKLLRCLTEKGFILIYDSMFYTTHESKKHAKLRSEKYYSNLNIPEMNKFYFHHKYSDLASFDYTILYNPWSFTHRIARKLKPQIEFPIIKICKANQNV